MNIIIICKISNKKHLNILELLQVKKKKIPIDFLFDEIDVDC